MKKRTGLYLSKQVRVVTMATPPRESNQNVTATVLRTVSKRMLPFYRKIALNETFARKWSEAVIKADLDRLQALLKKASPNIGVSSLGSNGIGYFVSFGFPDPVSQYASGTTIPPGSVQFFFETRAHREVAAAVIPLYRALATNWTFAKALAQAIRENDVEKVACLVRSRVTAKTLKVISIESSGIALSFRFSYSKFTYRNLLFQDVP